MRNSLRSGSWFIVKKIDRAEPMPFDENGVVTKLMNKKMSTGLQLYNLGVDLIVEELVKVFRRLAN